MTEKITGNENEGHTTDQPEASEELQQRPSKYSVGRHQFNEPENDSQRLGQLVFSEYYKYTYALAEAAGVDSFQELEAMGKAPTFAEIFKQVRSLLQANEEYQYLTRKPTGDPDSKMEDIDKDTP